MLTPFNPFGSSSSSSSDFGSGLDALALACEPSFDPNPVEIVPLENINKKIAQMAVVRINHSIGDNKNQLLPSMTRMEACGPGTCLLAKVGEEYVGYVITLDYTKVQDAFKSVKPVSQGVSHKFVYCLAVREDHYNPITDHIALSLMKKVVEDAKNQQVSKLILVYQAANSKAAVLYQKLAHSLYLTSKEKYKDGNLSPEPIIKKTIYLNPIMPSFDPA